MESSIEIEKRAAQWLARRDGDNWSEGDQEELTRWLATTAHRVAFIRLEAAWVQARRLKALGAGTPSRVVPPSRELRSSPFFERRRESSVANRRGTALRTIAASLVLAIVATTTWLSWPAGSSFRTPVGGLATVPMSDGSKITLNTDSRVSVDLSDTERRVELVQGEAFFEVAKDSTRPFVVTAGAKRVVAVGTAFSVRNDGGDLRIVVTEGRVRVEQQGGGSGPVAQLDAGDIARAGDAGLLIQEKPVREVEEYLSWRSGYVVFRDTPLADAVAEFNRYNERKILIEDPAVGAIRISGNFRCTNFEAFVRLIEDGFALSAQHRDDAILLTRP